MFYILCRLSFAIFERLPQIAVSLISSLDARLSDILSYHTCWIPVTCQLFPDKCPMTDCYSQCCNIWEQYLQNLSLPPQLSATLKYQFSLLHRRPLVAFLVLRPTARSTFSTSAAMFSTQVPVIHRFASISLARMSAPLMYDVIRIQRYPIYESCM